MKLLALLVFLFIFENLFYLGHVISYKKDTSRVLSAMTEADTCPVVCQDLIDKRINAALVKMNKASASSSKTVAYLPLGSGGSTVSQSWTTLSGSDFSFDLKDYSAGAKVYWSGNIMTDDLSSRCYARIYDRSNLRGVDYSEQSSSKTSFENLTSQALTIWAGKNDYRLELKSLNGRACYLQSPKLIIKY